MTQQSFAANGAQVNCGLIGIGVVGSAVLDFFAKGPLELLVSESSMSGVSSVPIHIWSASRRSRQNPRAASEELIRQVVTQAGGEEPRFFYDTDPEDPSSEFQPGMPAWRKIVSDPDVDIVVELTGSPVAEAIIEEALWNGKCVVTANKKVMSRSGYQLVKLAQARGTVLAYEAAVGGGMPIVQTIGASIGGRVTAMQAILNGTTNFILSSMREAARDSNADNAMAAYPSALCAATHAGLAEADPSADVLGDDAQSKLIILAGLAFGVRLRPRDVYMRGIARRGRRTLPEGLPREAFHACPPGTGAPCATMCAGDDHLATEPIFTAEDLSVMASQGYVPKLLAGAQRIMTDGGERLVGWVQPVALLDHHPLAGVDGSQNACLLRVDSPVSNGDKDAKAYEIMMRGPGAGGPETASSVIADIEFCARQLAVAGRLRHPGKEQAASGPAYMYGATAFARAQDVHGVPSYYAADDLVAPFFLRFRYLGDKGTGTAAQVISGALRSSGVEAGPLPSFESAPSYIYYRTAPSSIAAMEQALQSVYEQFNAAEMALDALYLPVLSGPQFN